MKPFEIVASMRHELGKRINNNNRLSAPWIGLGFFFFFFFFFLQMVVLKLACQITF